MGAGAVRTGKIGGVRGVRVALLAAVLVVGGCGREGGAKTTRGTTLDVAVTAAPGSPSERHWQWFVTNVRSWAPEYVVALVPKTAANGLESLRAGRAGIVKSEIADAAAVLPEVAVLELPLLFASDAEADHVLDRHVLPDLRRRFDAKGLTLLALTEGEPRVAEIAHATAPQASPGEDAGVAILAVTPLGDGAGTAAPRGRERVLLDTGHVPGFVLAPNAWFDPLTPHDEDVFRMAYATAQARADSRAAAAATIATATGGGALRVLADDERARVRERLAASHSARAKELGPDAESLLALVERGRMEFASGR
jgi:TRAP-type C4-dicarboxylate transport system substrate-binding protein